MLNNKKKFVLLLGIVCILTACGKQDTSEMLYSESIMVPEMTQYETVEVKTGDYSTTISGSASIIYPKGIELSWDKENTYYREILVKSGQQVKKGEVLAVFDVEESVAELEELKLQLAREKEEFESNKKERLSAIDEAKKTLAGLSSHELEIAKWNIEKLQISYEQYVYLTEQEIGEKQENINTKESNINNNKLLAPFDGVISKVVSYNSGDRVTVGRALISMYSTEEFFIQVKESGEQFSYNMAVSFEVEKDGQSTQIEGRVVSLPSILPGELSQSQVWIQVDDSMAADLLQGQWKYKCETKKISDVLLVDPNAVNIESGNRYVYVLENGIAKKRYIIQGFSNGNEVWVIDGLSNGQSLILN